MARSRHTEPRAIRAGRRLVAPRDPRGAGDLGERRRLGRLRKVLGAEAGPIMQGICRHARRPRVIEVAARPGYSHPASRADVVEFLQGLGAEAHYGLHTVELARAPPVLAGLPQLGRLIVPGRIQLFELPLPPWRLRRGLAPDTAAWLEAAGAVVTRHPELGDVVVDWPDDALRRFVLEQVLLHEIGHHILQHDTGKRRVRVVRTRDHEAFAELWAERCRAALALPSR